MGILPEFLQDALRAAAASKRVLFYSLAAVLLTAAFLYYYYFLPAAAAGPEQPIPFSHRVHAGVKNIQCRFCHPYVDYSHFPGIPPVEKCLYCHNYIIARHPQILKEHRFFDTQTPTPWKKVNYIPEHVLFNHQRHLRRDIGCENCHGAVATLDRLPARRFEMKFCITCHRQRSANTDCWLACHS